MTGTDGYLREWLRDPMSVAAVAPSGRRLAELITAPVPRTGEPLVVELGPGTGAFTAMIQRRLGGRGRHVAVELNPRFAQRLAERFPAVDVVLGDARDLRQLLVGRADVIVSGLPWASFGAAVQDELLATVAGALGPGGAFSAYGYSLLRWMPPAQRLRRLLGGRFEEVTTSRTVVANLPPAFVHTCRWPREGPAGNVPPDTSMSMRRSW